MCKKVLLIAIALITVSGMGCVVGVKEKRELLFVSPIPIPQAAKGVPVIAESEKVRLVVLDQPGAFYQEKITGYVVVDPWFYDELIKAWNKANPP